MDETTTDAADVTDTAPPADTETEPETFDREYVSKLRQESAKQADEYAQRLHAELVKASGRLADPADLAFDEEHLTDPEKLTQAIDALLEAKPHYKSRKPVGDIGQGNRGPAATPKPTLLGDIRQALGMSG
jgi:hypothetical protein